MKAYLRELDRLFQKYEVRNILLAYLFVSRICLAGLCFYFFVFALVLFVPLPPGQIEGGFLVCYFSLSFSFICFLDVAMVWKVKPASVTTGSRDRTYARK